MKKVGAYSAPPHPFMINPRESNMYCKCEKIFSHIYIAYCFHEEHITDFDDNYYYLANL